MHAALAAMIGKTRITSKRQLTIPAKMYNAVGLQAGDELSVTLENGSIVLTPLPRQWRPASSPAKA